MKRLFSILLLGVFLFQFAGYYFVYLGMKYQARQEMAARLEARDFSSDETVTLKIPFALPYWMDSKEYERMDGEFEYQGDFYKLVEHKLQGDTLFVVCIKDAREKKLFNTLSAYVKLSNDLPASSQKALKLLCSIIKDFVPATSSVAVSVSLGWQQVHTYTTGSTPAVALLDYPVFSPPPEFVG